MYLLDKTERKIKFMTIKPRRIIPAFLIKPRGSNMYLNMLGSYPNNPFVRFTASK